MRRTEKMCPYYTVLNMCFFTNEIEINHRHIRGQDAVKNHTQPDHVMESRFELELLFNRC